MRIARIALNGQPTWVEIDGEELFRLDGIGSTARGESLGALSQASLLAPVERTSKLIALFDNFDGKKGRNGPGLFLKPATAIVAPGGPIRWPGGVEELNFECELGVVIGKTARHVAAADANDYILGYTVCNDMTSFPAMKEDGALSIRFKIYDDFLPVGPWIQTGLVPEELRLRTFLNEEIKQDAPLSDMAFGVAETVAWISAVMTLEPGDIISMGTPPGFVPMARGDVVRCEIDGIGALVNTLV